MFDAKTNTYTSLLHLQQVVRILGIELILLINLRILIEYLHYLLKSVLKMDHHCRKFEK